MKKLRAKLQRLGLPVENCKKRENAFPPAEVLNARTITTKCGEFLCIEEKWSRNFVHGGSKLVDVYRQDQESIAALGNDDTFRQLDLHATAFIDTETTGLAGGTGTYAFLIGIGFFSGNLFCIRQYFMRGPQEEPAMLLSLQEFLQRFNAVVSFNGKSFDLPLLRTRFTFHRYAFPLSQVLHLDLLGPARRLWKMRLQSCSLISLEENILNMTRKDDIPGSKVPELYFEFLQTGDARPLQPVFTHNCLDILSMLSLLTRMSMYLADPKEAGVCHGADWHSLGRYYENLQWQKRAVAAYEQALAAPAEPELRERTFRALSFLHKKCNNWRRASGIWQDRIKCKANSLYPYEELAKYYEHQLHDYHSALQLVQKAMERLQQCKVDTRSQTQALRDLQHRLQRLQNKTANTC